MGYQYRYDEDEEKKEPAQRKLKTDRSALTLILLTILTLGLYEIFFFIPFSFDLDKAAGKSDNKHTMNYAVAWVLSLFTGGIVLLFWHYSIAGRIKEAIESNKIDCDFGTDTFWKWQILGTLIIVGPFVYAFKLCRAMNLLCADYNEKIENGKKVSHAACV